MKAVIVGENMENSLIIDLEVEQLAEIQSFIILILKVRYPIQCGV